MSGPPPHVVQIGCGGWGRHVLRDLKLLGAHVTVVNPGTAGAQRAREGGADAVLATLDGVSAADGVVVVTPASDHARALLDAARLGCPIFCEKPLVTDPADEPRLVDALGERLFVMHKWRWHPGIEALGALAHGGELGALRGVRTTRLGAGPDHFPVDSVDTLVPHDLSIAIAILGALPPVALARGTRYPGLPGGWCELSAVLAAGDGPRVAIEASSVSAHRLRRVEVTGTLGSAVLPDPEAPAVAVLVHGGKLRAPPRERRVELEREWPLLRELRDFVAHCAGGPPPRATAAEGFAVVRAIAELRRALVSAGGPLGA